MVSCVRTRPPEEVYITSTPDNLPFTDQPATVAEVTNAPIQVEPVTVAPVTVAPVTTAPVTAAPVTDAPSTLAPITDAPVTPDPCANCKTNNIQPTLTDAGAAFSIMQMAVSGECVGQTECKRTDGAVCNSVGVTAIIPTDPNPVSITDTSTTTSATSTIK
ncbi:unnamed protein product [Caenorhabditis nigoni]